MYIIELPNLKFTAKNQQEALFFKIKKNEGRGPASEEWS